MGIEAQVQTRIIKYLKSKGCYVIKTQAGPGTPKGCPDVIFFKEGFYGAVELKSSRTAPFQSLQAETIRKIDGWSWARVVYPQNYDKVIAELEIILP